MSTNCKMYPHSTVYKMIFRVDSKLNLTGTSQPYYSFHSFYKPVFSQKLKKILYILCRWRMCRILYFLQCYACMDDEDSQLLKQEMLTGIICLESPEERPLPSKATFRLWSGFGCTTGSACTE